MAKYEYYVVQGKTLDNVAETMKTVLGVDKDTPIRFDEITNNEKAEQVTENVDAQAEVIEQIKAALNGKSSIGVKEIMDIIDQSGVLESTDGTATEKVEQLIDKGDRYNWLKDYASGVIFYKNSKVKTISLDCSNFNTFRTFCYECANLESVHLTNTQNVEVWSDSFYKCGKLKTLETLDFSSLTHNIDLKSINLYYLENLKIVSETLKHSAYFSSPCLTDESIQSIIDGLATVETAQTLTLNATVKAKLTQTQLDTITSKNWNLA